MLSVSKSVWISVIFKQKSCITWWPNLLANMCTIRVKLANEQLLWATMDILHSQYSSCKTQYCRDDLKFLDE